jgi:hypothetical protein
LDQLEYLVENLAMIGRSGHVAYKEIDFLTSYDLVRSRSIKKPMIFGLLD